MKRERYLIGESDHKRMRAIQKKKNPKKRGRI